MRIFSFCHSSPVFLFQIQNKNERKGKEKPIKREEKADLPQKVERESAVIPNPEFQLQVEYDSEDPLHLGNDQGGKGGFLQKVTTFHLRINENDGNGGKSAEKSHGKMGFSSPKYFNQRVEEKSESKKRKIAKKDAFHSASKDGFLSYFLREKEKNPKKTENSVSIPLKFCKYFLNFKKNTCQFFYYLV